MCALSLSLLSSTLSEFLIKLPPHSMLYDYYFILFTENIGDQVSTSCSCCYVCVDGEREREREEEFFSYTVWNLSSSTLLGSTEMIYCRIMDLTQKE